MQRDRTDLDRHFGDRLRAARRSLGLSPTELASRLGLSEISIEEYESGRRRIAASDLIDIAGLLGVDVGYFFSDEDAGGVAPAWLPSGPTGKRPSSRESFDLLRAFRRIPSAAERRRIVRLIEALGGEPCSIG